MNLINGIKNSFSPIKRSTQLTFVNIAVISGLAFFSSQSDAQIQFDNVTNSAGPFHTGESWGASWCDINGDKYPDLFVSNHNMATSIYRNNGGNSFTDIIEQADLDQVLYKTGDIGTIEADIHGASCADWDNDGDQDIFATRSSTGTTVFLLENDGTGKFRERRQTYNLGGPIGGGRLPVHMDYNGDGKTDVAIAKYDDNRLQLFKQVADKKLLNTTTVEGIAQKCDRNFFGFPSRLFDDDKHLYFCMQPAEVPERVFNTTVRPFVDVTHKVDRVGIYSDATMADFNNDLKTDMLVVRGKNRPNGVKRINPQRIEAWVTADGADRLIKFKSTGSITVQLHSRTVATKNSTLGIYDKIYIGSNGIHPSASSERFPVITLDPDIKVHQGVLSNRNPDGAYLGYNTTKQEWEIHLTSDLVYFAINGQDFSIPTLTGLTGADADIKPTFLFNDGNRLVDSGARGIDSITCNSVIAEDFDNDMDVDVYVGCSTSLENLANRFYWNNGDGSFSGGNGHGAEGMIGAGIGGKSGTTDTVSAVDYNIDGFIDILVTQGSRIYPHSRKDGFSGGGPDQLFRNAANNANKWLEIDLRGVSSTRDGFGTKVIVTAGGISQLREQDGRYHRWSHDHRRLHFGLKNNNTATVRIEWPDGTVDIHNNVGANKLYQAVQDGALINITPGSTPADSQISINGLTVSEGADSAVLSISLTPASTTITRVSYATANGTALAGSDYTARSGVVTFQPGQVSKTATIQITDDTTVENSEYFTVLLSNPTGGATISQSTGTVTINDNDSSAVSPCGNPNYDQASERGLFIWKDCINDGQWYLHGTGGGGSPVTYKGNISTNSVISNVVPISLETSDTLVSNEQLINFTLNTGSVWRDGFKFSLEIGTTCLTLEQPVDAKIYVGGAKFQVSSPFNIETLGACTAGTPVITINNRTISESVEKVIMDVQLSAASSSIVMVNYATSNGTAISGTDYIARNGRITFQPGQTQKTATITLLNDNLVEDTENFNVNLSNATGGAIISQSVGTVTINDDD